MWQFITTSLLSGLFVALLVRQFIRTAAERRAEPFRLFSEAKEIIDGAQIAAGEAAGTFHMTGTYRGRDIHATVVTDTLAVRKLPSLWLMATIPIRLPVKATLDLMMRPTSATSFSNFDNLPFNLATPAGFPDHLVIRSDAPEPGLPLDLIAHHIKPLRIPRGKELLITPNGLRLVYLLAEADRARYGVFRQADFGEAIVDPRILQDCLDNLLDLQADIEAWQARAC